ncbi:MULTISPECIES: S41 family peptidase [unclassified Paenibacillus]|uniref:S41 family peptidase n=1 Tax=unclassified Paenibacillus TaxID=185978 RepID=UPI001AE9A641|nr:MULTISPECIES: S41 family peptidase [unclassified Paenibacillus]MBP1157768.1 carboxyl-terminal processing protease [Paenibacillus sp. PvP091]MBP1171496.1 carboxyl-terminal processing protease [Paenibacillus sp. PvR098]MBP2442524.1 carboxyl-terminal processing protease [Paenibacillus sp. PvP052]
MNFKGRTVLVFVLLSMFAGSIMTLTIVNPSIFAAVGKEAGLQTGGQSGLSGKDLSKIAKTYQLIESKFLTEVDHEKVVNGAINGMLSTLEDPFTVYMDQKEAEQFDENITSSFQGIGAEVTSEDGKVVIVAPIKGAPAERAGLHANDVIVSVNGEKLEGLSLNQAIMKIRGPKGTQAKLEIVRSGSPEPIPVIVVRDDIDVETVYAEMLPGQIGKIEIRQFSSNTSEHFNQELKVLEEQGMKGLIIDVRNDPGGLLSAVVEIVEPFIPKGKTIVQIENRKGEREETKSQGTGKPYPVSVLINKGSASASEILAGALHDSAGSKLIGENTFGKGTVQVTFEKEMGDGSNIKMTVYKWLTPNGTWVHKNGIAPNITVEQPGYFRVAPLTKKEILKPDMNNEDVKNLQIMLQGLGLSPERMDGYFNGKTQLAVKAFQRMNNLPVTGEVDKETAEKLEKAILEAIRDTKNDLQLKAAIQHMQSVVK